MKTVLKGILTEVSKIESISRRDGNGAFLTCNIYVFEKPIISDYGTEIKPGQVHEIKLYSKMLDQLPADIIELATNQPLTEVNVPVELELYVNSRQTFTKDKRRLFITELNPKSIKFIQ